MIRIIFVSLFLLIFMLVGCSTHVEPKIVIQHDAVLSTPPDATLDSTDKVGIPPDPTDPNLDNVDIAEWQVKAYKEYLKCLDRFADLKKWFDEELTRINQLNEAAERSANAAIE